MFEGDFADICPQKFPLVSMGGTSGLVKHAQMASEDPHRRDRIFNALPGNQTNLRNKQILTQFKTNPKSTLIGCAIIVN